MILSSLPTFGHMCVGGWVYVGVCRWLSECKSFVYVILMCLNLTNPILFSSSFSIKNRFTLTHIRIFVFLLLTHTLSLSHCFLFPQSFPDTASLKLSGGWNCDPFFEFWPNTVKLIMSKTLIGMLWMKYLKVCDDKSLNTDFGCVCARTRVCVCVCSYLLCRWSSGSCFNIRVHLCIQVNTLDTMRVCTCDPFWLPLLILISSLFS